METHFFAHAIVREVSLPACSTLRATKGNSRGVAVSPMIYQILASRLASRAAPDRIESPRAEFVDRYGRSFSRQYLPDLIVD